MKKICVFVMSGLPIPAVNGGAIETLLQLFIDENEKKGHYDITVLSNYNAEAEEAGKRYKHSHFVYFKSRTKVNKYRDITSRLIYRATRIITPNSDEVEDAIRYLKDHQEEYDLIINENWKIYLSPLIAKAVPVRKVLLHLHRKGEPQKGDITKRLDRAIGTLVTVSHFVADDWMSITGRSPKRTAVLANCCNAEAMRGKISEEEKKELRARYGIEDDEKVVLFTGRITDEKGVLELAQAFNKITEPKCMLLILGGAKGNPVPKLDYEKQLNELIANSKAKIVRTGYVDNRDIYKYYNIADLAVLPSVCPEAAALTVIESLTAGMPVLTTNQGGIPEYAKDGCAVRIDVDDQFIDHMASEISRLLLDPEERARLSENALKRAEAFEPSSYYDSFCKIIDKAIARYERSKS